MKVSITVKEYIEKEALEIQEILNNLITIVKELAPNAEESISFGMPTYKLEGKFIVQFHAAKTHLGFYPQSNAIEHFKDKLSIYKTGKHTVNFLYNKPIPYQLIKEIIAYRIQHSE